VLDHRERSTTASHVVTYCVHSARVSTTTPPQPVRVTYTVTNSRSRSGTVVIFPRFHTRARHTSTPFPSDENNNTYDTTATELAAERKHYRYENNKRKEIRRAAHTRTKFTTAGANKPRTSAPGQVIYARGRRRRPAVACVYTVAGPGLLITAISLIFTRAAGSSRRSNANCLRRKTYRYPAEGTNRAGCSAAAPAGCRPVCYVMAVLTRQIKFTNFGNIYRYKKRKTQSDKTSSRLHQHTCRLFSPRDAVYTERYASDPIPMYNPGIRLATPCKASDTKKTV